MTTTVGKNYWGRQSLWNEIFPYILKVNPAQYCEEPFSNFDSRSETEKWSSPNDPSFPEQGHFNPSVHNDNGKIGVTAAYFPHPFNNLVFEATSELSDEFPLLEDRMTVGPSDWVS